MAFSWLGVLVFVANKLGRRPCGAVMAGEAVERPCSIGAAAREGTAAPAGVDVREGVNMREEAGTQAGVNISTRGRPQNRVGCTGAVEGPSARAGSWKGGEAAAGQRGREGRRVAAGEGEPST